MLMISVVIPLYNKAGCIASTLESVLAQTFRDFEIIVVDDGSTDGGADVASQLLSVGVDSGWTSIIRKENGGVCSARNAGIQSAQGEWVAFLDADDLWEPTFLEEMAALIRDYPDAGIVGSSYYTQKKGVLESAAKPFTSDFRGHLSNPWQYGHYYWTSAVCCKKTALEEIGLFDERIAYGEDIDVWWRIMLHHPAAYINRELAVYRFDEENRAMDRKIPLEKLYVYYFEKYAKERLENTPFRHFIDKECMWWLYPYAVEDPKNKDVHRILQQINLREYKLSFRLRFMFPKLYKTIKTRFL